MTDTFEIPMGDELVLVLDANPTTGYSWEAEFDHELLVLVGQEHRRTSELIGAGGKTILTFRPIKKGEGTIVLRYRRPWEAEAIESRTCSVTVI